MSERLGTKTLMQLDSTIMDPREAEGYEQEITKTMQDVFGIGVPDPRDDQLINALSVAGVEELSDDNDPEGGEATKDLVLERMGLNEVFTNADMGLEERIDFFKQYIASTLNLDSETLKKTPSEGTPYLAMASALLNASKDGQSRMSGFGQAMVAYGLTKRQMQQVGNKEAGAYLMKSFDLGLEAQKMATAGTGKMGATEWVTVPWSTDPTLLPKESIVNLQQGGIKILPYNKEKDDKRTLYSIPRMTDDGIMFEYKKLTEPQYQNQVKNQDTELTKLGYEIKEADSSDRSQNILYNNPETDSQELMTQADYLALPFDKQTGFEGLVGKTAVIDTTDGNRQKWVSDEELSTAEEGKYQTLNFGTYFKKEGDDFIFSTGRVSEDVLTGQTNMSLAKLKAAIREPLQEKIKQSKATFRLLERSRKLAREGLFGTAATTVGAVGNFIKSVEGVTNAYQKALDPAKRANYTQMKRDWYQEVANDTGFLNFVERTGADKDRLMGTFWSLALASAQILNDQKGRDISNVDAERFLNRVGANSSSVAAVQMMLDDLEDDLIHAQLDQYSIERSGLEAFPTGEQDTDGKDIMKRIFTDPGDLFGVGGLVEEREAALNAQLEELQVRRKNAPTATGQVIPGPTRPLSYSRLNFLLAENASQKGKAATIINPASKPTSDVTWGTLAKIIYRDQFLGNDKKAIRKAKSNSRLRDHFYNDPDAAREFKEWYNTILGK